MVKKGTRGPAVSCGGDEVDDPPILMSPSTKPNGRMGNKPQRLGYLFLSRNGIAKERIEKQDRDRCCYYLSAGGLEVVVKGGGNEGQRWD
jgi:hypothetical protein